MHRNRTGKEFLITSILCLLAFVPVVSQNLWSRTYLGNRPTLAFSSIERWDNGYIVGGVSSGYPPNLTRIIITTMDSNGDILHYKVIGDSSSEEYGFFTNALIKNHSNDFAFTGYAIDSVPSLVFGIYYPQTDSISCFKYYIPQSYTIQGFSLLEDDDQNYYITGVRTNNSPMNADVLLIKIDASGQKLWQKYYNHYYMDYGRKIIRLSNGNLMIGAERNDFNIVDQHANTWLIEVDTGGNLLHEYLDPDDSTYAAEGLLEIGNGNFIYGGKHKYFQSGTAVYYLASMTKTDTNFDKSFMVMHNVGSEESSIYDIERMPDGGFVGCGNRPSVGSDSSEASGWIIRIDSNGAIIWSRNYEGFTYNTSYNYLTDIDVLPDGSIVAVGSCENLGQSPAQTGWMLKIDSNGCLVDNCLVGVSDLKTAKKLEITINPNPCKEILHVSLQKEFNQSALLSIYNTVGDQILSTESVSLSLEIDVHNLAPGIYFLASTTETSHAIKKFIKE